MTKEKNRNKDAMKGGHQVGKEAKMYSKIKMHMKLHTRHRRTEHGIIYVKVCAS